MNLYITAHGSWVTASHFWTLAVEEQFYLLWPWLVLFLPRRWIVPTQVIFIALGPISRALFAFIEPGDLLPRLSTSATFTTAALDSLGAGALLAYVLQDAPDGGGGIRRRLQRLVPWAVGAAIVSLVVDYSIGGMHSWFVTGDLILAVVFCWLVAEARSGFSGLPGRFLTWRPLVFIGVISYGVYVFHWFVRIVVLAGLNIAGIDFGHSGVRIFLLTSAITLLLAAASWFLFERPINRFKSRFGNQIADTPRNVSETRIA